MLAIQILAKGGAEQLGLVDVARPKIGAGELLVKVSAAGISPNEFEWGNTWHTPDGEERVRPIPGHEFSGTVEAVSEDVAGFSPGDEVFGLTDFFRDGCEAEYTRVLPSEISFKPKTLEHAAAASLPLDALTAWQGLLVHGGLVPGQRVLVHGGAGGVGSLAVQLAKYAGGYVIATCSRKSIELVKSLDADEVIDYRAQKFEKVVAPVHIVFDTVGGQTLERSWSVIRPGGILVSISALPSEEKAKELGVRCSFFIVQPDKAQLSRIRAIVDASHLRPVLKGVCPLAEAKRAYELASAAPHQGKVVLAVGASVMGDVSPQRFGLM